MIEDKLHYRSALPQQQICSDDDSTHKYSNAHRHIQSHTLPGKLGYVVTGMILMWMIQVLHPLLGSPAQTYTPLYTEGLSVSHVPTPSVVSAAVAPPSFSSPSSSALSSSSHAVFATAFGYSFTQVYVFVRSFRVSCSECQMILFVDSRNLTFEDHIHFRHFRVQLMYVDELVPLYQQTSIVADQRNHAAHYRWQLYYDYLRTLSNHTHNGLKQTQHFNPITMEMITQARHRAYSTETVFSDPYGSMGDRVSNTDLDVITHVFFCDSRDVIFQNNIFNFLPYQHQFDNDDLLWQDKHTESKQGSSANDKASVSTSEGVFAFTEERLLGNEPINTMWISCAQPAFVSKHAQRPVVCSGATLADISAAIEYLDALLTVMYAHMHCVRQYKGFDQGAHILVLYSGVLTSPVYLIPNARGPVANIAMMNHHPLRQSDYGQLINERNEIYAVVHQYDRQIKHLKPWIEEHYHMVEKDKLEWWASKQIAAQQKVEKNPTLLHPMVASLKGQYSG